jgi:hypothetical protein
MMALAEEMHVLPKYDYVETRARISPRAYLVIGPIIH